MNTPTPPQETSDFSLVLGGPLFQLCRRAHLSGPALEFVHRRMLVITLFACMKGRIFGSHGLLLIMALIMSVMGVFLFVSIMTKLL